ncbi:MAG: hypothetical protein EZS28_008935 [Streblomastix strix]|uniref:NrS-1 polymerase-like helicase domain-containing protein n=1 Tax=Streblomastix strix TaxID=222440 RepID=A0A5J4WKS8_9EUKA|nr:MAG: hypothetical protein EZS28_008935 [Streblomastix strix]
MYSLLDVPYREGIIYDAFNCYRDIFCIDGVKFYCNSTDHNIFNLFQGFRWNKQQYVDEKLIQPFLDLIFNVITSKDKLVYEYILNWISFICQHIGKKTQLALVLQSEQGVGKNKFTDTLSKLFQGYSKKNLTKMEDITEQFNAVLENKILVVLNEARQYGLQYIGDMNALKSIITECEIEINQKHEPKRQGNNVANIIIVSNNSKPIWIETSDRRYLVCQCSGQYLTEQTKFDYLFDLDTLNEYFDNLLTYFSTRDISNFKVRDFPLTNTTRNIVRSCVDPVDEVIIQHYSQFKKSYLTYEQIKQWKPNDVKANDYQLVVNQRCDQQRKQVMGQRQILYRLKSEMYAKYDILTQQDEVDDNEEDNVDFNPITNNIGANAISANPCANDDDDY